MDNLPTKIKKLGLVLAGGGSLGSYEVGAIEVLKKHGYKFDIVTGTSIGALNGAFYMGGQEDNLRMLWSNITPTKVMVDGFNFNSKQLTNPSSDNFKIVKQWSLQYVKNGIGADITPFKHYIRTSLDVDKCMESNIKLGIEMAKFPSLSAVDMNMNMIKDKDLFLSLLHASSACFPVFPIETINNTKYVDGFYNDNVPMRLAFEYGADELFVIDMRLFDQKPQHKFYLKLPNVHYIAPYSSLGSMLDFSQESIQKSMKLGELDTKKFFKEYRGFYFAFKDVELVDGFLSYVLHSNGVRSEYILNELSNGIRTHMDETDYYICSIEAIALRLDIDNYYEAYSIEEFKQIIIKKIREINDENALKPLFSRGLQIISESLDISNSKTKINYLIKFSVDYLNLVDENGKPLLTESMLYKRQKRSKE